MNKEQSQIYGVCIWLIVLGFIVFELYKVAEELPTDINIHFQSMDDVINEHS